MAAGAPIPPRIALDAMGGDRGPNEVAAALALALAENPGLPAVTLTGPEAVLRTALKAAGLDPAPGKIDIVNATEVIEMTDKPLPGWRKKRDASMVRAIELVKSGAANVAISCGNTGALMAGSTLTLGRMPGIDRPALTAIMPHGRGHFVLVDVGANPEASARHLVHQAVLGSRFCSTVLGKEKPRVGLLTIGTEEGKGNAVTNEAHIGLKTIDGIIHYAGLIEGFQVFRDEVDVIVCDGFTGNIVLKTCESLFLRLKDFLKEEFTANPLRKTGALLGKGAFDAMKTAFNPDRYGGAPLLGLRGMVLKAHGSSNSHAIASALRTATKIIEQDLQGRSQEDITLANQRLEAEEKPIAA
jgi:glycerol-3-phosphate acyltransferase PlsX